MISLLLLMLMGAVSPKLQVWPLVASEPTTITFLLTGIPDDVRYACFALDGENYYGGCQEVGGRHSIQVQYRDVRAGCYTAGATLDEKIVSVMPVKIVGRMGLTCDEGGDDGGF